VESESGDPSSMLSHYRSLIALRAANAALVDGSWTAVTTTDPSILAYLRTDTAETLLVVANLGDSTATSPSLSLTAGPLCGHVAATLVYGSGTVTAPAANATGGFSAYAPVASLAADDAVVIRLAP
jgi:glycosidase